MSKDPVYGDARLIEAVRHLRWLARQGPCEIQESIDLLDEAGIFDPIDKTTGITFCPCGNYAGTHPFPGCPKD